ncbi:Trihelix transcription factor DF1 [Linum perenne]
MLGDTTTSVSSSVNPGGGGGGRGGGATANTHHHQYQSHHNQNPPSISSSAAIGGGLIQEGIGEAGGGGGSGAGHVGSSSGGEEDRVGSGDRSFGGNRWPRQETLALLKIRTDMDATFRDASVKGPLWEDVSRKLGELGYHRSAKKCKEKFENVYKYHKRTKDGRVGKHEGKTYRYFEQLEAFETHPPGGAPPPPQPLLQLQMPTTSNPPQTQPALVVASHISTVPSTTVATAASIIPPPPPSQQQAPINTTTTAPPFVSPPPQLTNFPVYQPPSFPTFSADLMSNSTSTSSTSSDVELHGRHKRKRKWKDFFGRLMTEVVQKQEEMQRKFLEAIEKREQERMAKEESWRLQELSRINREREILAQERSIAAAKDAAVMSFLQKLSEQQPPGAPPLQLPQAIVQSTPAPLQQPPTTTAPPPPAAQVSAPPPQSQSTPTPVQSTAPATPVMTTPSPAAAAMTTPLPAQQHHQVQQQQSGSQIIQMAAGGMRTMDSEGDRNYLPASSSRWPKVEVEALISLRTNLDSKYQENGPKGPLWEEISAGMKRLGYNRSSKRCKEKWENINKYFKKVKESNRKRPEDSKTCPYFHQLDALYRHKSEGASSSTPNLGLGQQFSMNSSTLPLMVQPEQQWPPPPPPPQPAHHQEHRPDLVMHDMDSEDEEDEEDEEDDDDDEEGGGGGYELVSNKMNTGGQ